MNALRALLGFGENVAVAAASLRQAKGRSALTILGVVLGVATVMAMATIVRGVQAQIIHTIELAGPTTFYVMKVFSQTPLNPDNLPAWVRARPDLTPAEAERLAALPEVQYAAIWAQILNRVEYAGTRTNLGIVMGADAGYPEIYGGELVAGRWFTQAELRRGDAVVVLDADAATKLFGAAQGATRALDAWVRVGGHPARVIGIYQAAANIFEPPGQKVHAIVGYRMMDRRFAIDRTNALFVPVKPRRGVSVADAQGAVTVALRERRGLRPGDRNTFDFITQDQILDTFNKLTGVFFLVMLVLSAVALLVGGIGVMAVMMISVTDRTREIGIRKAVGATRRDIMQQFLLEAAALTGVGGAIGIAVGLSVGRAATAFMNVSATPPLALTLVAVAVSVGIGLVFGLLPARKAARLDPIDALRYE
ncbi:ABC transporter permease [Roseisolibacter agri]|uniref:ABC transporter ATP-binding protein n=1 Tax=Roseisolibacter agri TaxID=2014610 RepID=A0AA37Q9P6_9BACT|nr:ABC transporter permease [Roseisolibacter agri]GLC25666.1 ABC transporter ATP-binding protein [Roseisolibacter agri]